MLPSRYAPQGISHTDSRRTITVGSKPRPPEYILTRLQQRIEQNDSDMMDIDFYETYMISDLLQNQRSLQPRESTNAMELYAESLQNGYRPPAKPMGSRATTMTLAILVIDTNFMLSNLKILDEVNSKREQYDFTVVIPIETVRELDGLKRSDKMVDSKTMGVLARWANDWIYAQLAKGAIKGQDYKQRIDKHSTQDDSILDCCLWFKQNTKSLVILFSNDKNLCVKALSNEILTVSYKEGMDAELICRTIYEEAQAIGAGGGDEGYNDNGGVVAAMETDPIDVGARTKVGNGTNTSSDPHTLIYNEIFILTKSVIHHCMEDSFGEDLELIREYDPESIHDLQDCKELLVRYWHTVFRPFVPRRQDLETLVTDTSDIEDLLHDWKFVLKTLYLILDDRQRAALMEMFDRWDGLIVS